MDIMHREQCLRKIQELEFAVIELNLYLDTHPTHQQALMDYNKLTQELMNAKIMYERQFGPLTNFGYAPSQYPWQWIESPWPWENEHTCKEDMSCGSMKRN
ncbi:spore coat protein CotJB [Defluviitalea phaphyphila]|uniref:spore coat protein CotJB n=1 Tax=Defluviitalea phaphyphila TaxID=1473580 RepID=UPI000731A741|nr:spore coat protein CotJB [Defluviitalea phaphyphila]